MPWNASPVDYGTVDVVVAAAGFSLGSAAAAMKDPWHAHAAIESPAGS